MLQLPAAFAAMANYRQWMLYKLVPSRERAGKMDKFPATPVAVGVNKDGVPHRVGDVVTAHPPEGSDVSPYWVTADEAIAIRATLGDRYGVAFVLTTRDPFWFLDIDGCAQPDGTWSALARQFLLYFSGCAVEVSSSGQGLHIIGTGDVPPHGKVNPDSGLEFYTERRFIALTGSQASGDAATVAIPNNLQWLVQTYFQPKTAGADSDELTDEPVPEWRGPKDDDDLIRRAMRSISIKASFGNRASFGDLWEARPERLAQCFPPQKDDGQWNASVADSALASHLAFWTGKDGERIKRLMFRSALVRGKWDRDDYMISTINGACATVGRVLQDEAVEPPPLAPDRVPEPRHAENTVLCGSVVTAPEAVARSGSSIVYAADQKEFFRGCVYVRSLHRVWVPTGELLKPEVFAVAYGGYLFAMDPDNQSKPTQNAWEAFTQSRALRHPQVAATCFRPKLAPGHIVNDGGRTSINTYLPLDIPMIAGDVTPFLEHLKKLVPNDRDRHILLCYLAALVQYKGTKFKWCIVLQGVEGNGKTFISMCAEYALGKPYTEWPAASGIASNFNAWMFGKLLYCVDDILVSRGKTEVMETLKPMITGETQQIEGKGIDQTTKDICGNFIFNTNHKHGIRKSRNDRRFCIFFNPQQEVEDLQRDGMDAAYVSGLYDWAKGQGNFEHLGHNYGFAAVAHYLANFEIDPEFNPAGKCQRAPKTTSTHEAIGASLGTAEQFILDAIAEGRRGFRDGWVSSVYLGQLLEEIKMPYAPAARGNLMRSIGFVPHPSLPNGRTNNVVDPDRAKPVLYVDAARTDLSEIKSAAEVSRAYTAAQIN